MRMPAPNRRSRDVLRTSFAHFGGQSRRRTGGTADHHHRHRKPGMPDSARFRVPIHLPDEPAVRGSPLTSRITTRFRLCSLPVPDRRKRMSTGLGASGYSGCSGRTEAPSATNGAQFREAMRVTTTPTVPPATSLLPVAVRVSPSNRHPLSGDNNHARRSGCSGHLHHSKSKPRD